MTVLGIEFRLDPSLAIIFLLILFHLGAGVFPQWHPDWALPTTWAVAGAAAVLFIASIAVHELAHSLVARWQGMQVSHITLFLFGGVSNIEEEPSSGGREFLMAVVGPLASIALGIAFLALGSLLAQPDPGAEAGPRQVANMASQLGPASTLLLWLGPINLLLGVFNLLPGFPLDGGRILRSALWAALDDLRRATAIAARIGQAMGWTFILIGMAMVFGIQVPVFGSGPIGGLWLAFIGWFLSRAAASSYTQTLLRTQLEDVHVRDVMQAEPTSVDAGLTVQGLVDDYLTRLDQRCFPVVDEGRFVGLVCMEDVRDTDRSTWESTAVRDVMTGRDDLATLPPGAGAMDALTALARHDVGQIPVVVDGELAGVVRRRDIVRWVELQGDGPNSLAA